MSQNGQPQRSTDPADYQRVPRAVAAMPKDFADGFEIAPHSHERAQLIYATAGTMRVATADGMWMVPPQRALWMPAGVRARHRHARATSPCARSICATTPPPPCRDACRVLPVSPLLRELIVRATELPLHYDEDGPAGHVVALILAELHGLQSLPLAPADAAANRGCAALCRALLDDAGRPAHARRLGAHRAMPASAPLARLFQSETGLSFGAWRQQARVLEAMGRLGGGAPVTQVALDLGYDSVSAFSAMFRRAAGASPSPIGSGRRASEKPLLPVGDFCVSATA